MKLSIITINYNNACGLRKTIDSVLSQSFCDKEWIVIDGGSTDGSEKVITENAMHFSYYCIERDKGVWDAMNKGTQKAKGEYICFLNSGDVFAAHDVLDNVFGENTDADIIYGDTMNVKEGTEEQLLHPKNILLSFLLTNCINHQSAFIKRYLQKKFPYDLKYNYASDRKFWIQAALDGAIFKHVSITVAKYDCDGISSNHLTEVFTEHKQIVAECLPASLIKDMQELLSYKKKLEEYPVLRKIFSSIQNKGFHRILLLFTSLFSK